jgi:flagellar hook-associated protein 2
MPVTFSGFDSGIDTDNVIRQLVDLERKPIVRMQNEKKGLQYQKEVWKDFNKELTKLDDISKDLFGFKKVFNNRKVVSGSDEYFSSTVLDNAPKGNHTLEVLDLARAHKITSDELSSDREWPGAVFTISVGDEKAEVKGFQSGGKIDKLVEAVNSEASKLVNASLVKTSEGNAVLSIESLKTGEKNQISIRGDAASDRLQDSLGLSTLETSGRLSMNFNEKKPVELPIVPGGWSNTSCLLLEKGKSFVYTVPDKVSARDGVIEFLSRSVKEEEPAAGNGILKNIGSVNIRDLVISGANVLINAVTKLVNKDAGAGGAFIRLRSDQGQEKVVKLVPSLSWTNNSFPVDGMDNVKSLEFVNNSGENFSLDNLKVYSKSQGKTVFKNIVQKPMDVRLKVDGIEVKRDKNDNLNDLIKGVNFSLTKKTVEPVKVDVRMNSEAIQTKLDDFIKQYNAVQAYIQEAEIGRAHV